MRGATKGNLQASLHMPTHSRGSGRGSPAASAPSLVGHVDPAHTQSPSLVSSEEVSGERHMMTACNVLWNEDLVSLPNPLITVVILRLKALFFLPPKKKTITEYQLSSFTHLYCFHVFSAFCTMLSYPQ